MPARLISAVWAHQHRAVGGDQLGELPAGEPLVSQDDQPRPQPATLMVQHGRDHLPLAERGGGQAPGHPQPVRAAST